MICPSGARLKTLSSTVSKNIPLHSLLETPLWIPPSRPSRGAFRDRHERWAGMRWTRQRLAREGLQGGFFESVSDQQHADERRCCVRRSHVVLTPRRWRQVWRSRVGPTGLRQNTSARRRWQKSPDTRARRKPLKPLRAGMSGDSGVLVVTRVRSTIIIAHETAGALGIRHSPRPLSGGWFLARLGCSAPRGREVVSEIGRERGGCVRRAAIGGRG